MVRLLILFAYNFRYCKLPSMIILYETIVKEKIVNNTKISSETFHFTIYEENDRILLV